MTLHDIIQRIVINIWNADSFIGPDDEYIFGVFLPARSSDKTILPGRFSQKKRKQTLIQLAVFSRK